MKPPINPSSAAIEACISYWLEELHRTHAAFKTAREELIKLNHLKELNDSKEVNDAEPS